MRIRSLAIALAALAVTGCGGSNPTSPGIQPQIVNNVDDFAYQVSNVSDHTGTWTYVWQNTGTQANVDQSTSVSSGTVTLTLLDAAGTVVYTDDLSHSGSFTSSAGVAGAWRVRVVYQNATCTVNFRAQKKT